MPLIVEDGSGIEDADSYVSLADADAYWIARNNAGWSAAEESDREAALRQAADYLSYVYRFPGQPTTVDQRLAWPRTGVPSGISTFASDAIPSQIVDAQLLLAVEAISNDLLTRPAIAGTLTKESVTVRGISRSREYQLGGVDVNTGLQRYPLVDELLRGFSTTAVGGSFAAVPLLPS